MPDASPSRTALTIASASGKLKLIGSSSPSLTAAVEP